MTRKNFLGDVFTKNSKLLSFLTSDVSQIGANRWFGILATKRLSK